MARRTATVLNAFLHSVSSEDFNPADQDALQDVLLDYFADATSSDKENDSESDCSDINFDIEPSTSYELTMIERYVELRYTLVRNSRIMTICTYIAPAITAQTTNSNTVSMNQMYRAEIIVFMKVCIIPLILQ